jgi:hypothetical protein
MCPEGETRRLANGGPLVAPPWPAAGHAGHCQNNRRARIRLRAETWARLIRGPARSNCPKCPISNSVSTRTFRAGWCPGGRIMKIPISVSGYRFMSATKAPDAKSFSIKNSGSAAMPSPATAAAACHWQANGRTVLRRVRTRKRQDATLRLLPRGVDHL